MPLGFFGGGSSSNKPQVFTDGSGISDRKESKMLTENNCKGVTLKLTNTQVTIEKQLAEGGFAIVYLVTDKKNKKFALKRQFVLDNQKQLDACIRECKIVKELRGHRNIVEYIDHMIGLNKYGQYDCMLLTVYHKRNVLQLMNERISNNMYLAGNEILNIFCDMCEAVGRLHHSQTPVIHRDLKVENILIDERNRAAPPIFVLCDFGSATTKTMSINTHSALIIQDEIDRNTTLCYRSPEMIDIYSGQVIGTKSDLWSLGVMLYRLCYFSLPFEESALAIQNGIYAPFPEHPAYSDEIRAIIYYLLDVDVNRRPTIFECASLAFEAYGKSNPIENVYNVKPSSLKKVIAEMKNGVQRNKLKSPLQPIEKSINSSSKSVDEEKIVEIEDQLISEIFKNPLTTSVMPRLRPKASALLPTMPSIPAKNVKENDAVEIETTDGGPLSCPILKPSDLGFTDLDNGVVQRDRASTDLTNRRSIISPNSENPPNCAESRHRRNVSDTSQISKSAFKPYSQTTGSIKNVSSTETTSQVQSSEDVTTTSEWNPFLAAPFSATMKIHQNEKNSADTDDDASSIDFCDPFGSAPFDKIALVNSQKSATLTPMEALRIDEKQHSENDAIFTVKSVVDEKNRLDGCQRKLQTEDDSEIDEQRMKARRRYSYENIDGVGDDATSSDSRGRTDRDDSEDDDDDDDETDECSRKVDTSHDDEDDEDDEEASSQNTVGSEDGEGGSRPLLEDDGLEDDDDNELLSSFSTITSQFKVPLFIGTSNQTNPFLRDDLTPKMVSPAPLRDEEVLIEKHSNTTNRPSTDEDWDLGNRWADRRDTVVAHTKINADYSLTPGEYAPATLPRQVTPLTAVSKLKPDLPSMAPVSIIPSMSTTSFPEIEKASSPAENVMTMRVDEAPLEVSSQKKIEEPVIGTLIQVGAPTSFEKKMADQPKSSSWMPPMKNLNFVEGPKTPKIVKSKKMSTNKLTIGSSSDHDRSPPETDGSEAEMCATNGLAIAKKKKKSGFTLRSSHPSIVNEKQFVPPIPINSKKMSKDKKNGSNTKRASTGTMNASFVNSSFQCEEIDVPTK